MAISQFMVYFGELTFGSDPKTLYGSIMSPVFFVGSVAVSDWDLSAIDTTLVLTIALAAFLRFTKEGQFLSAETTALTPQASSPP